MLPIFLQSHPVSLDYALPEDTQGTSLTNNESTYLKRANDHRHELQEEIKNETKFALRRLIAEKMHFYNDCEYEKLENKDFKDILDQWHAKASPIEQDILNECGFQTVSDSRFSLHPISNARDKVHVLNNFLFAVPWSLSSQIQLTNLNKADKKTLINWLVNGKLKTQEDLVLVMSLCIKQKLSELLFWVLKKQQLTKLIVDSDIDNEVNTPKNQLDNFIQYWNEKQQNPEILSRYLTWMVNAYQIDNTLQVLDLRSSNIGTCTEDEIIFIAECLKNYPSIKELRLGPAVRGTKVILALADLLKKNNTLKTFQLVASYHQQDQRKDLGPLFKGLEQNKTLQCFALKNSSLSDVSTQALANWLTNNNTLTSLDLSHNNFCVTTILNSLQIESNLTLKSLILENSGLDDNSAEALATSLEKNTTLSLLDISQNFGINKRALNAIGNMIEKNRTLTWLKLGLYTVRNDAAMLASITRGLTTNPQSNLQSLVLIGYQASEEHWGAFCQALKSVDKLTSIAYDTRMFSEWDQPEKLSKYGIDVMRYRLSRNPNAQSIKFQTMLSKDSNKEVQAWVKQRKLVANFIRRK